jgi:hypothetical protein
MLWSLVILVWPWLNTTALRRWMTLKIRGRMLTSKPTKSHRKKGKLQITMQNPEQHTVVVPASSMFTRIAHQRKRPSASSSSHLLSQRNLEEALDARRAAHDVYAIVPNFWRNASAVDFCSGNILGMADSPERRAEFLSEFTRKPDFSVGSM